MKTDTQHLEFLISQYVDGTLDAPTRKTIEQQLLTDPAARELYKEHRETQDLLDDLGSRIPLINWNEFESQLSTRLENEEAGTRMQISAWRRWLRPVAVAASLIFAVGLGYMWANVQGTAKVAKTDQPPAVIPMNTVQFPDRPMAKLPASSEIGIHSPTGTGDKTKRVAEVSVIGPGTDAGTGMGEGLSLNLIERFRELQPGAVAASSATRPDSTDKEPQ